MLSVLQRLQNVVKRFNANSQTFIIRFWSEPREVKGAASEWRGVVEHVQSGEQHYFKRLDEISTLLAPYLENLSTDPTKLRINRKWWERIRSFFIE